MKTHYKKIWPEYFKEVKSGNKPFEVRENDEDYQVGDILILQEYIAPFTQPLGVKDDYFTGEEIRKEITYVLRGGQWGIKEGYCILGLKTPFKEDVLNRLIEDFGMDSKMIQETYESYMWTVNYYKDSIKLKNIDLTGISLPQELDKRDEEYKEFSDALLTYLYDPNEITKEHLKEEACDVMQVVLSILKKLDINVEEIAEYWNTKHLEKIKDRPRQKGE